MLMMVHSGTQVSHVPFLMFSKLNQESTRPLSAHQILGSSHAHLPGDTPWCQARGDRFPGECPYPGHHHHNVPLRLLLDGGSVPLHFQ